MVSHIKAGVVLGVVVFAVVVSGCGSSDGGAGPDKDIVQQTDTASDVDSDVAPQTSKLEYQLFETTVLVEGEALAAITAVNGDGSLSVKPGTAWGDTLAAGQVLVLGQGPQTPYGLLREVVSVQGDGQGAVVTTQAVPIQKAFRNLDVEFTKPLVVANSDMKWNDLAPRILVFPGDQRESAQLADGVDGYFGPLTVEFYPFNGDNDTSTPEDQVRVSATVGGGLSFFYGMEFHWPEVWEGDFLPEIEVGFNIYAGAEAHLAAEGVAAKNFKEDFLLGSAALEPFAIGPLVFFPSVELWAALEGGASSRYTFSAGATASFEAGISYSTDDGGKLVPPTPKFEADPVVATAMEQAYAKASIGPRLKLALYGIFGPYAEVSAYTQIEATSDQDPCWKITGGFEGEIGVELEIWGASLAEWGKPFNIFDMTFAEGSCLDDPLTAEVPDVTDPTFTPWNRMLVDTVSSWEPDRSRTFLEQTVDGHFLLGGGGTQSLTKIGKEGELFWSREYLRDNAVLPIPQRITAAAMLPDTTIVAAGFTPLNLMALTNNGMIKWTRRPDFEFQAAHGAAAVLPMPDGGLVLASPVVLKDMGDEDVWVTRFDAHGSALWSKRWGRAERNEFPTAMVKFHDDLVVIGRTFGMDQDPADQAFVLRITPDGDVVWARDITGCDAFSGVKLQTGLESMDGDLILGGSYGLGGPQQVLIKIKQDGSVGWANVNAVSFLGIDLTGFFQLSDGGYLAVGTWWTASDDDWWIARMDSVGKMFWLKRLNDTTGNGVPAVALTGQGGAMAVAVTNAGANQKTGSLWVSRFPVKNGAIALTSPATIEDAAYTLNEGQCIQALPSTGPDWIDFPVYWVEDPSTTSLTTPAWNSF